MARDSTAEDMMAGYNLLAVVNAKQGDVHNINADAPTKRQTAEGVYQEAVSVADGIRDKAVTEAEAKRNRTIKAQDNRVETASKIAKEAQVALNEFQDKLESETGVRVPLPGGGSAPPSTVRI